MDTATRDRNIATWLGDAPQPVRNTTNQLLERIALLRAEQTIYPAQDDILNALAYTPANQVKVVILGQDPYHGPNQAMGLSFSVPATQTKLPPSLRNIYKELNADLGCPIPVGRFTASAVYRHYGGYPDCRHGHGFNADGINSYPGINAFS